MAEDEGTQKVKEAEKVDNIAANNVADKSKMPQDIGSGVQQVNREFQEKSALKVAKDLGLPYVNISKTPLNPDFFRLVDFESAKAARLVPFFRVGKKVRVAVENPQNDETKKLMEKLKSDGYEVTISLASASGITDILKVFEKTQQYKKMDIVEDIAKKSVDTFEKEIADLSSLPDKIAGVTAQEGLNMINMGAMKTGASDIHYEPEGKIVVARFRIDGILHKAFELEPDLYKTIASQIKFESKMKLNTSTVPQDGRYLFNLNDRKVAVRVSSIPTPYGESFVCRFLAGSKKKLDLEDLGFQGLALKKLEKACKISHGMILSTGPTGSGKTTTLYSLLNAMNNDSNKVITLEDPVEYNIDGVTQSQIDEKSGYSFVSGLRTVLRQDPDIVMLGEIRDIETAETAAQASLTGHVLLSTLHTNSAIETIPRLINMGLPPFMVAPSLDTIIAQRLVRKVCSKCSTMEDISDSARKEFEEIMNNLKNVNPGAVVDVPAKIPKIKGCSTCSNTGYQGRLVVAEVITVSSEIRELILAEASIVDLIAAARKEGIVTMREDGFIKVAQGLTTLEEVYRVTNVSS
jgi:type IV pilus assembly protein PilB